MKNKKEDWQSGAERRPGSHHKESHVSQRNLEPHLTAPLPPRRERTREILASRRKTKATRSASRARSSGSSFALCREGGALKKKADKKRAKQKQANGIRPGIRRQKDGGAFFTMEWQLPRRRCRQGFEFRDCRQTPNQKTQLCKLRERRSTTALLSSVDVANQRTSMRRSLCATVIEREKERERELSPVATTTNTDPTRSKLSTVQRSPLSSAKEGKRQHKEQRSSRDSNRVPATWRMNLKAT